MPGTVGIGLRLAGAAGGCAYYARMRAPVRDLAAKVRYFCAYFGNNDNNNGNNKNNNCGNNNVVR